MIRALSDPDLNDILSRFPQQHILVVGDVMLDEYVWGVVRRMSQEAPVPIVEVQKRTYVPGGAANVAANVAGLGAVVHLIGVIGQDEAGKHLSAALAAQGIALTDLVVDSQRPTTTKTRILAQNQQMARMDHEDCGTPQVPVVMEVRRAIRKRLPKVDACILSDYNKGLVFDPVARCLIDEANAQGKPVIVDPKASRSSTYRGATLLKPNLNEAGRLLYHPVCSPEDVLDAGRRLLATGDAQAVLITCGPAGMTLFEPNAEPLTIPSQAREVYDVTGAGDTVAATLAVAMAAGASLEQAARLANRAAGIVVGKVGTTPIRLEELEDSDTQAGKGSGCTGFCIRLQGREQNSQS